MDAKITLEGARDYDAKRRDRDHVIGLLRFRETGNPLSGRR